MLRLEPPKAVAQQVEVLSFCSSILRVEGAGAHDTGDAEDGAETSSTGNTDGSTGIGGGDREARVGRGSKFGLTFLHLHLLALLPAD